MIEERKGEGRRKRREISKKKRTKEKWETRECMIKDKGRKGERKIELTEPYKKREIKGRKQQK